MWFKRLVNFLFTLTDDPPSCRLLGHDWLEDERNPYKRQCKRCKKMSYLLENKYPRVGEPRYEWSND